MSLLRNLVASIALFKVAKLITEFLMLRVLEHRKDYKGVKFEHTIDFHDKREEEEKKRERGE